MSEDQEFKPVNQERDSLYNREPGIAVVAGSNFAKEVSKYEQFPSQFTIGTTPGNPYTYRPYPKMLYRAEEFKGAVCCMAAPVDPYEFKDEREYERAREGAERFTHKCQRTVGNETERSRAFEDGWRESPDDAVQYLLGRQRSVANDTAHRNYEDRGMSDGAKREIAAAQEATGGRHMPEVPTSRVDGRSKAAREAKKAAQEPPNEPVGLYGYDSTE